MGDWVSDIWPQCNWTDTEQQAGSEEPDFRSALDDSRVGSPDFVETLTEIEIFHMGPPSVEVGRRHDLLRRG